MAQNLPTFCPHAAFNVTATFVSGCVLLQAGLCASCLLCRVPEQALTLSGSAVAAAPVAARLGLRVNLPKPLDPLFLEALPDGPALLLLSGPPSKLEAVSAE